jgi:hypothetical protein
LTAILWISAALVFIAWAAMLMRHGVCGFGGCLASLLQILLTMTAILLLRVAVSHFGVLAATTVSVLTAVGNAMICHWTCPKKTPLEPACHWWRLGITTALVAVVFGCLFAIATALYALAGWSGRDVAVAMLLSSAAALLTSLVCLPGLIALNFAATSAKMRSH